MEAFIWSEPNESVHDQTPKYGWPCNIVIYSSAVFYETDLQTRERERGSVIFWHFEKYKANRAENLFLQKSLASDRMLRLLKHAKQATFSE